MTTSWLKTTTVMILTILFTAGYAAAETVSVTVSKAEGTVQVRQADGEAWAKIGSGDKLSAGSSVKTGPGSFCILAWGEGHVVKLQELSSLDITELERDDAGKDKTRLDLGFGKINAHVERLEAKGSSFTVKTPTAIAGVRGTGLFARVAEDLSSVFGVTDGEIYIEVGGIETVLTQDFFLSVDPTGEISPPQPMPEEMKKKESGQIKEAKQQAQAENASQGKDGKKTETETASATTDKEEAAEPEVDVSDAAADAVDTITDNIMEEQMMNEIVDSAGEAYQSGQFDVDIYVEP